MGNASYTQTSFLGGEISKWAQGQFDKPYYKIALEKALNIWPSEEGAAPRRPGFRLLGVTNKGRPGRLIAFDFSQATPYNLEFTDNAMRLWNNLNLVTTNDSQLVQSISGATPAVFTLSRTVTWATGDTCTFNFTSVQSAYVGTALLNRQFTITMLNSTQFNVSDAVTGEAIGTAHNVAGLIPVVNHVLTIPTPYSVAGSDWHSLRMVQGYNLGMLLHTSVAPQALQVINPPTDTTFATFTLGTAPFQDGPYLDPAPNAIATPSSVNNSLQIIVGYASWVSTTIYGFGVLVTYQGHDYISLANNNVNNAPGTNANWQLLTSGSMVNSGAGFVATDVGRMIRLFSQPPIWSPGTTYGSGAVVTYNGSYFTSLAGSNLNNEPDISITQWIINPSGAIWTWGFITAVNSQNNVTVQIQGAPLLYNAPILVWRLGAWSNTTGWPTCGCYQEGRFWFGGAIPNRVDSSQPNQPFNMAPTGQDGTVADSNGISYILNATEQNPIFWMIPDHQGIIIGTQEGEFLMTSGTTGNPITPSNIQARRETKYGSSNILPVRTGLTVCFVKRYARRIMEYLADIFSGRFFGVDLTQNARHLGARVIEEIDYQEELIPTVWGRCADGSLIGATYRRNSLFSTQPPEFNGWHQHQLGSERVIESISVGPSVDGSLDALSMVTNEPTTGIRFVEQMTTLLDESAPLTQSWFLDTAITPGVGAANINSFFSVSHSGPQTFLAGMGQNGTSTVNQAAMPPIAAVGSQSAPSAIWVGGVKQISFVPFVSGTFVFQIEKLDVTGDIPVLLATFTSASFTVPNGGSGETSNKAWSLDPSGRYIVMYTNSIGLTDNFAFIFDTQTNTFGSVLNFTAHGGCFGLAWIDSSHFVISDCVSGFTGTWGVQSFSVSGTTITSLGYTNVWGSGSFPNLGRFGYTQFLPNPQGGLIYILGGIDGDGYTSLKGISIKWVSGSLSIGAAYTISAISLDEVSVGQCANFVLTNPSANEWSLCIGFIDKFYLVSFIPKTTTGVITRPFQEFLISGDGANVTTFPVYYSETNTIVIVQGLLDDATFMTSTLFLDQGNFIRLTTEIAVTGSTPGQGFGCYRIDSERMVVLTDVSFGTDLRVSIITDPLGDVTSIKFYGLGNFNGKKVSVFAAGIDCGDYIVTDSTISVASGIVDPVTGWVFNEQTFELLQPMQEDFSEISVSILYAGKTYQIPCVIGFNYESQGQLCRPQLAQDTGAKNGPGFGKKRQSTRYAIQVVNSLGTKVGTKLNKMKRVPFNKIDSGGKKLEYLDTFSGIIREQLDDDFSYDSMLAWKTDRPYPTTVTVLGAFIETNDV